MHTTAIACKNVMVIYISMHQRITCTVYLAGIFLYRPQEFTPDDSIVIPLTLYQQITVLAKQVSDEV